MTTFEVRHPVAAAIAAGVALVTLLAGIPAVLLTFFWPIELPRVEDLVTPAEPQVLKPLLLLVVWGFWALFAWAVLLELVAMARGRTRQAGHAPFQRFAAYLVAMLTITTASPVATASIANAATVSTADVSFTGGEEAAAESVETAPQPSGTYVVKPRDTLWSIAERHLGDPSRYQEIARLNAGRVMTDGHTFAEGDWLRPGWVLRMPPDAIELDAGGKPSGTIHTVADGETLWDIADRYLGDGKRYREIIKFNKGRVQHDGRRLTDPRTIVPGWRLAIPDKSAGKPVFLEPAMMPPMRFAAADASELTEIAAVAQQADCPSSATSSPALVKLPGNGLVALSFAGGIVIALASARLYYRRRLKAPEVDERVSVHAEQPLPPAVQALVRAHTEGSTPHGESPPDDFSLVKGAFSVTPPGNVRISEHVELELSGLSLGLTGTGAAGCARAMILDLLTKADQHRAEIIIPRDDCVELFGEPIESLLDQLPGLRLVPSVSDAIDRLEEQFVTRRRLLRDYDAEDIPALRTAEPDEPLPALLLVARLPEGDHSYLSTLMELAPRFGIGALVLGEWPPGSTCHLDGNGKAERTVGEQSERLDGASLIRVSKTDATSLLRHLAAGNGLADNRPQRNADLPLPRYVSDGRPVRFGILGEPSIEANGENVDISGRTKALELFVLLALRPTGLERQEICAYLWPDVDEPLAGYRFHSALKDIRAALREATGMSDKEATFIELEGKTYRIEAKQVTVDLWIFERAMTAAREAPDEEAKVAALEAVAGQCRGILANGLKYWWIDQEFRWPMTVASVRALLQLGRLHENAGRTERALDVYEQAGTLDPDIEQAATAAIRLLLQLGRRDEARLRARHFKSRLAALGAAPSAETIAIINKALPRSVRAAK
ncbi:hypothetical protein DP939_43085 [Spongiactinospora rosea]|uniref:LysM domain-containing protein n=1 Tax=Spongiactinospora rosea TaxID=2248750 RepID=A0A366LJA2_9ACTN|nr:LysM peptidoglycan-binding domain-containing protein [Spongiactinospora rosea]RBQ13968.1 hypothetical protein DP939_43085 [Spongiactinospora rosea]